MRPSWHIDLKWAFGLLALAAVFIAGAIYSVAHLTAREPATAAFTQVMTSIVTNDGDPELYASLQAQAAASPNENFSIEGVTLPIKGSELAGLTYEEAAELVIGRIANTLYSEGPEAVERFFPESSTSESEGAAAEDTKTTDLGAFSIFTQDGHNTVGGLFRYPVVIALFLIATMVFFSRGFGRLGSPGVVLAVGTAPFAIIWLIADKATSGADGDGVDGALAEALSPTVSGLSSEFLTVCLLGVAVVAIAFVANFAYPAASRVWRSHFGHRARTVEPARMVDEDLATKVFGGRIDVAVEADEAEDDKEPVGAGAGSNIHHV
jgi:hypothetical protein